MASTPWSITIHGSMVVSKLFTCGAVSCFPLQIGHNRVNPKKLCSMICVGRRSWVSLQMDICHKRFVASIACSWLSQSTWSNWADDHIASFLILSRSAEECTFEWMLRSRLDTKWQPVISGSAIEVGGSRGIVIGFGSPVGLG